MKKLGLEIQHVRDAYNKIQIATVEFDEKLTDTLDMPKARKTDLPKPAMSASERKAGEEAKDQAGDDRLLEILEKYLGPDADGVKLLKVDQAARRAKQAPPRYRYRPHRRAPPRYLHRPPPPRGVSADSPSGTSAPVAPPAVSPPSPTTVSPRPPDDDG